MSFVFIDIIYSIIILTFAIVGAVNGFLKELFSKLAVIVGLICCFIFTKMLSAYTVKLIPNHIASVIISFLLIFIAAYLTVKIIQHFFAHLFEGDILKGLDRLLGFVFGAAEGIIVVALILIIVRAQPWTKIPVMTDHSFYYHILEHIISKPTASLAGMLA